MALSQFHLSLWSDSGPIASAVAVCQDLLIVCDNGTLATSQVLLAAASPLLRSLLDPRYEREESGVQVLLLPGIDKEILSKLIELVVRGSTDTISGSVEDILDIANLLDVDIGNKREKINKVLKIKQEPSTFDPKVAVEALQMKILSVNTVPNVENLEFVNYKKLEIEAVNKVEPEDLDWAPEPSRATMTCEELVTALLQLSNSRLHLDGKNVVCGLCEKMVQIPGERKRRGKVMYFRRTHYKACWRKLMGGEITSAFQMFPSDEKETKEEEGDDRDCLEEVWRRHLKDRGEQHRLEGEGRLQGRRKTDLPSIETIRTFLEALGGAVVVEGGTKVRCGICMKKFRVTAGRPIMGNLRYFEKTHLLRCKGRVGEAENFSLISDSFCERKFETKVRKSATPKWDKERGDIVCEMMTEVGEHGEKTSLGRPKIGQTRMKALENYISKRKQSMFGANICFDCNFHFQDISAHFNQKHPDLSDPFYCLACQNYYPTYSSLIGHLDNEHNFKDSYFCEHCPDNFETQSKLNRHISEVHPEMEMSYPCNMCTKALPSFPSLKQHQKTHEITNTQNLPLLSIAKAFTCRFCNVEIMYGPHLELHIRTEHMAHLSLGEKPFYCHICPQEQSHSFSEFYYLELHLLKTHGVSMDNICRFCRKASNNRNKFVQHFKDVHPGENPFECPRWGCNKTLSKKNKMKDHIVMHRLKDGDITEDMKKLCNECGKVFYIRKKLEEHIRLTHKGVKKIDTKEKKHQCHLCIKAFFSNSQLQEHIRKHEGNPGYMCDHCGKGFYRKDRLAIHSKTVHFGEKNFACSMCEKKFIDNYKLKRHMKTHETARNSMINPDEQPSLLRKRNMSLKREGQLTSLLKYEIIDSDQGNSPVNYRIDNSGVLLDEDQPVLVREATDHAGLTSTQQLVRGSLEHNQYGDTNLIRSSLGQQQLLRDSLVQAAASQKKNSTPNDRLIQQQYIINNQIFHC
eukprot:GFUD01041212.1.p1 GENE.GFUD01041212.1~~GFUD01041212.1.p1  ORF type:complete len:969 (+),score=168.60 GFUD01041212.1:49-2955(+)